jgi:hypothetical protein
MQTYFGTQTCVLRTTGPIVIHDFLHEISTINRVKLQWVSGYRAIDDNEKADELARQRSGFKFCGPELCYLPLFGKIRK